MFKILSRNYQFKFMIIMSDIVLRKFENNRQKYETKISKILSRNYQSKFTIIMSNISLKNYQFESTIIMSNVLLRNYCQKFDKMNVLSRKFDYMLNIIHKSTSHEK